MQKLKKVFSKFVPVVGILGMVFIGFLLFRPTFFPGECAIGFDNHIWKIEGFTYRGVYEARGWFEGQWGETVELEREILENEKYKVVICPDPTIFRDVKKLQE